MRPTLHNRAAALVLAAWAAGGGLTPRKTQAASCHSDLAILTDVDPAHVTGEARRAMEILAARGAALQEEERRLLEDAFRDSDAVRALTVIQQVVDRHCLVSVSISTEGEVRAAPGPARPILATGAWDCFVIKVDNGARITSAFEMDCEQALVPGTPSRDRWLRIAVDPPGKPLSGHRLDYYVLRIRSEETGEREASFLCWAGGRPPPEGRGRALLTVPFLFSLRPPEEARALARAAAQHVHKEPRQGPPLAIIHEASCRRCHVASDPATAPPDRLAAENRCLSCHRTGMPAPRDAVRLSLLPKAAPEAVLALLRSADPERGQAVFFRKPLPACSDCHRLGGNGTAVGPDLAGLAQRATPEQALNAILHPSATIAEGYRTVLVVTEDERILTGLLRQETDQAIRLVVGNGQEQLVPRADIRERHVMDHSLMPEDAAAGLTEQDLADLLRFLLDEKERKD